MTVFSLRQLKLRSGEEFRDEAEIVVEPLALGGQRYLPVPDPIPAELTIHRASTGSVFELGFDVRLHGPCFRCLEDAVLDVPVRAREYQATKPDDDELRSPYVADEKLDLSSWARDAIVLELPEKILCRADCAGLCPVCGKNLNDEPHQHEEDTSDPRWSVLESLRDRL
jgi:uncharacterized protein